MSAYDEATRRELRAMFVSNGLDAARAAQTVDLACHAAERSVEALMEVCKRGSDHGVTIMAIEVSLQLAMARMKGLFERTHDFSRASGVHTYSAEVGVPS